MIAYTILGVPSCTDNIVYTKTLFYLLRPLLLGAFGAEGFGLRF